MVKSVDRQYKAYAIDTKGLEMTDDGQFGYFKGYAITWGNVDRANEVAVKGCFAKSLQENPKVKMQWQHDTCELIGSYTKLEEDDTGLYCEGRINLGVSRGKEAYALLKAGDIDSLSIGYMVLADRYDHESGVRYLDELELYEISLVSVPCNPQAQINEVKSDTVSIDELKKCNGNVREIERVIKGRPLSASVAKYLAGLVVKSEHAESNNLKEGLAELAEKMKKLQSGIDECKKKVE